MQSKEAEEFRDTAAKYCHLIDSHHFFKEADKAQELLFILSALYVKALALPDFESESETVEQFDFIFSEPLIEFEDYDAYAKIFDPYQDKKPVIGFLSEDILDIYTDVKKGLLIYEQGACTEAVREWKFSFEVHWGKHATSAIYTLHSLKSF